MLTLGRGSMFTTSRRDGRSRNTNKASTPSRAVREGSLGALRLHHHPDRLPEQLAPRLRARQPKDLLLQEYLFQSTDPDTQCKTQEHIITTYSQDAYPCHNPKVITVHRHKGWDLSWSQPGPALHFITRGERYQPDGRSTSSGP